VPDLPSNLFGRDKLLDEVLQLMSKGQQILLHGFGGMGKTALAARLAHDFLKTQKKPVLWLHLGSLSPESVFEALAQAYEAGPELSRASDKAQGLREVLQKQQPGLLVLDDAWNAYAVGQVVQAMPKGLPLLVTSRQRLSSLKRIAVDRLERPAALELLSHHSGHERSADPSAAALCELLGDHAFAVRLAGLSLGREQTKPAVLLERIKDAPHELKVPGELSQAGYESVASLLNLSLEALSDGEYEAFLTYGILPNPRASAGFVAACVRRDVGEVEEALLGLAQRGLADRIAKAGSDALSYRLHDLAHSYAQANRLHRSATLSRAAMGFLEAHKNQVALLETDITNILSAAQTAHDQGRQADLIRYMYLLCVEGTYFTARGHTGGSVELLKRAAEWALGAERLEEAHYLLGKIGDYYANFLADYARGIDYYVQATETAHQVGNLAREAVFLSIIGQLKSLQNEPDAEKNFDQAYEITRSIGDDLALSTVLEKHGYASGVRGDYHKSFKLLNETLDVIERLEHDSKIDAQEVRRRRFFALLNLAEVEHLLGSLKNGVTIFQEALHIAEESGNEIWAGYAHCQAADMHHRAGNRPITLEHMQEALKLFEANNARKDIERVKHFLKSEGYVTEEAVGFS
jgi:tetratricopeptide (TPR) repeat protein